ncbi:Mitochondrial transcription termination factor family protein [Raphanus sativus]|nr:Mitochondrial transcription termination factor family protein [Raphanus sativus]
MSSSLILRGRRRLFELQKWRHLRFTVQNASPFSSSTASAATVSRKGQNFTVSTYLVKSLGFTTKLAESISKKVSFEDKGNPDSVLNLFRTHGFTDSQISSIISGYPQVLIADAERSLAPKLQFLKSRGASTSELTEVLSNVPKILVSKKDKALSIYYDFVKDIVQADKSSKLEKLSPSSLPRGIPQENKMRNLSVLRDLGMPQKFLFSLLTSDFQLVCGKDKFEESLKKVLDMGFDPTTPRFVEALRVVYAFRDKTIKARVEVYKRLGFTEEEVWTIFKKWPSFLSNSDKNVADSVKTFLELGFSRDEFVMIVKRFPTCIGLSVELVKKKAEFFSKEMDWPLKAVVLYPSVLGYSMEKRIVPRCNVIKALISKGLLGVGSEQLPSIRAVLECTDQVFLNKYVMKHEQIVAELMTIFTRGRVST